MLVYAWVAIFSLELLKIQSKYANTHDNVPSLMGYDLAAHGCLVLASGSVGANDVTWNVFIDLAVSICDCSHF